METKVWAFQPMQFEQARVNQHMSAQNCGLLSACRDKTVKQNENPTAAAYNLSPCSFRLPSSSGGTGTKQSEPPGLSVRWTARALAP